MLPELLFLTVPHYFYTVSSPPPNNPQPTPCSPSIRVPLPDSPALLGGKESPVSFPGLPAAQGTNTAEKNHIGTLR